MMMMTSSTSIIEPFRVTFQPTLKEPKHDDGLCSKYCPKRHHGDAVAAFVPREDDDSVDSEEFVCSVCFSDRCDTTLLPCQHSLCWDCAFVIITVSRYRAAGKCPICRAEIDGIFNVETSTFIPNETIRPKNKKVLEPASAEQVEAQTGLQTEPPISSGIDLQENSQLLELRVSDASRRRSQQLSSGNRAALRPRRTTTVHRQVDTITLPGIAPTACCVCTADISEASQRKYALVCRNRWQKYLMPFAARNPCGHAMCRKCFKSAMAGAGMLPSAGALVRQSRFRELGFKCPDCNKRMHDMVEVSCNSSSPSPSPNTEELRG